MLLDLVHALLLSRVSLLKVLSRWILMGHLSQLHLLNRIAQDLVSKLVYSMVTSNCFRSQS